MKNYSIIVISLLTLTVAVLGVLYYQETKDDVRVDINIPDVTVKKN